MKVSLTSRNHQDFRQRYSGTFGWFCRENGTKKLVQIIDVSRDRVEFSDDSDFPFYAIADSNLKFEFIPVDRGWFNGNDGETYFLARHPARQWKRGIHSDNTLVYKSQAMGLNIGVSYQTLAPIFDPANIQFGVREKPPFALSKHFAVDHQYNVWFYNRQIGALSQNDNVITLNNSFVQQELQDVIKRNNYNLKVVVNV